MPAVPHLLIVDDDPEILSLVGQFLEPRGFRISTAADGAAMRSALALSPVDLIILDLMLPGEDGLTLCRELRSASRIPVIFLTAASSEADRIVGLEMGADDYLPKPFGLGELLARIRAVLRRVGESAWPEEPSEARQVERTLLFSGWILDLTRRRLTSPDGVLVELSGGEYELLYTFLKSPQIVLNRDQLLDATQGRMSGPFDRSIDVQVGRLRRKIEKNPKNPELIKTVRGGGYVLVSIVEQR
jgi:two-component system OmpR family response regulator